MRNMILGTVAGLLIGGVGAYAYSHYLGDGGQLSGLQAQLDAANAKLAAAKKDSSYLQEKYNSATEQLTQIQLDKPQQADAGGDKTQTPAATPLTIGGMQITPDMIRGFMAMMPRGGGAGGFRSPQQRMLLLQTRLKLTPDQAKQLQDAMAADEQARRDAFQQARTNHTPPDMSGANSLETKLTSILTPAQQVQYQQVQSDEKAARAETAATQQIDNLAPLLQLSDDQKEKAMAALYQQQLNAPDPASLRNDPNILNTLTQQGQGTSTALKQVLSADQYAIYQQSDQLTQQAVGNFAGNRRNAGNGNNRGQGQGQGQGQTPAQGTGGGASGSVAASGTTTTSTGTDTTAATTNAASGTAPDTASATNAAPAATNAASGTPPAAN